jgi:hypothetical protein
MKGVMKRFFSCLFVFIIFGCDDQDQKKYNIKYFQNFNVDFSGIVAKKRYLGNSKSLGMLLLKNVNSKPKVYDPLDSLDYFYFASYFDRGVLIENKLYKIQIGDSVSYNTKEKVLYYYRNDRLILVEEPFINTHIFAKPDKKVISSWLSISN